MKRDPLPAFLSPKQAKAYAAQQAERSGVRYDWRAAPTTLAPNLMGVICFFNGGRAATICVTAAMPREQFERQVAAAITAVTSADHG